MCKVIAVAIQKGGSGKTTTCVHLGIGLAYRGAKVLLIDADPQGSLTACLGYDIHNRKGTTTFTVMRNIINNVPINPQDGILKHNENIDLLPSNNELAGMDASLIYIEGREMILKKYTDIMRDLYDYIIIDCMSALSMLTINVLACADSVLIPMEAAKLSVEALQQQFLIVGKIMKSVNPKLVIEGVLVTMVDLRSNHEREIIANLNDVYGKSVTFFKVIIPRSVQVAKASAVGKSIYVFERKNKASDAYKSFTEEVLNNE